MSSSSSSSKQKHPSLHARVTTPEKTESFARTANGIGGGIVNNRMRLEELDEDIKADEKGIVEYKAMIKQLAVKRELLDERVKKNRAWLKDYEESIGPFQTQYANLVAEIESTYGEAKERHRAGVEILIRDFDYHPTFKRWDDNFTATPFVPK